MPKLILLDPGHDTTERGSTQIDGQMENVFTLALAKATRDALLSTYECKVELTHEGAGLVPGNLAAELHARGQKANDLRADFFLSIHHNAGPAAARGAEYYIHTDKRADDGGLVWLRAVDPGTGAANHAAPRSYAAAQAMVPILEETLGRFGIPWRHGSGTIMCADFAVLRYPNLPCGLIETHYGTNAEDNAAADRPDFIPAVARGIAKALAVAVQLPELTPGAEVAAAAETWALPKVKVVLPDGKAVWGEVKGDTAYAILPGMDREEPVRTLAEAMGLKVGWTETPPTVTISYPKVG